MLRKGSGGSNMKCAHDTFVVDEYLAGPYGGQQRLGRAIYPDGKIRRVWAGIPDTFFSIPAHGKIRDQYVSGLLMIDTDQDSPTYEALRFHVHKRYLAAIRVAAGVVE